MMIISMGLATETDRNNVTNSEDFYEEKTKPRQCFESFFEDICFAHKRLLHRKKYISCAGKIEDS
jgi:hypothetical protein